MRRNWLVILSLSGAACQNSIADDEHALLQSRQSRAKPRLTKPDATSMLDTVRNLARTVSSVSPATVLSLVASLTDAVGAAKALLPPEHTSAQSQLDTQFAEIEACGSSVTHGAEVVAEHAMEVSEIERCNADKAAATSARDEACNAWIQHAQRTLRDFPTHDFPMQLSDSSAAAEVLDHMKGWYSFAEDGVHGMEARMNACNEATTNSNSVESLCHQDESDLHDALCRHQRSCTLLHSCHEHEVGTYSLFIADSADGMAARQAQFRTLTQAECLLALIATAVEGNTTAAEVDLNSCDGEVSVDHLTLSVPNPETLTACPSSDPECAEVEMPLLWTAGSPVTSSGDASVGETEGQGPWQLIAKQGSSVFDPASRTTFLQNPDDPDSNAYMIVGQIDSQSLHYLQDGKYKFKLIFEDAVDQVGYPWGDDGVWGQDQVTIIWEQTSWLDQAIISGFIPIEIPFQHAGSSDCYNFRGLGKSSPSVLDGNGGGSCYFNTVGATAMFSGGIPAFDGCVARQMYLYIATFDA